MKLGKSMSRQTFHPKISPVEKDNYVIRDYNHLINYVYKMKTEKGNSFKKMDVQGETKRCYQLNGILG